MTSLIYLALALIIGYFILVFALSVTSSLVHLIIVVALALLVYEFVFKGRRSL